MSNQVSLQKVKGKKIGGEEKSTFSSNSNSGPDNSAEKSWKEKMSHYPHGAQMIWLETSRISDFHFYYFFNSHYL